MATPQHRCVFVGNIPYDATEEQLIQICEEVGPVVSFRLVIDRDTGKPKGYGFCEYKDEETALSARRNLQGYEINGRQLRVDFAENDKNVDRSREQGRGGPGMVTNVDPQKQFGGPAVRADSGVHQPIDLPVAMTAANIMAGALGGAQTGIKSNQNSLQTQQGLGTDPLTLHLAKFSRNQLNEILSELKVLATENKEQARQLLLTFPSLSKAVFQAQMMLGVVTPQMLQMPNIRQASGSLIQPSLDALQGQQPQVQTLPGLPPLAQNKIQFESKPKSQESEVLVGHPNPLFHNQYTMLSQLPSQPPQVQLPIPGQNKFLQQGPSPVLPGVSTIPSIRPQQMINMSMRPQIQVTTSSSMKQQVQPPLLQHPGQVGPPKLGHNGQLIPPHGNLQPSALPSSSKLFGIPNYANTEPVRPPQVTNGSTWVREVETYQSLPLGLSEKATMVHDNPDPTIRSSKLVKLNDGKATSSTVDVKVSTFVSGSSQVFGTSANQIPKAEEASSSINQTSQLPPEVESALLQQVLNLTPEQLSSLPPDQQQQVIQLQQMLRLS